MWVLQFKYVEDYNFVTYDSSQSYITRIYLILYKCIKELNG